MSKYLDRLQQSADEKKKASATTSEAHARASVEQKVSSLKAQSATLAAAYNDALGAVPFNVEKVMGLTAEVAQNKADLTTAQSILDTEFAA